MEAAKAIAAIVAFSAINTALIFVGYETSPTTYEWNGRQLTTDVECKPLSINKETKP